MKITPEQVYRAVSAIVIELFLTNSGTAVQLQPDLSVCWHATQCVCECVCVCVPDKATVCAS